jgi:hypothetical protein
MDGGRGRGGGEVVGGRVHGAQGGGFRAPGRMSGFTVFANRPKPRKALPRAYTRAIYAQPCPALHSSTAPSPPHL